MKLESLDSSPGKKRRFSSSRISPGFILAMASSTLGPVTSSTKLTLAVSLPSRSATGLSDRESSRPSGRPKWEMRIILPASCSRRYSMVGRLARMRKSLVTLPSFSGTL